MARSDSAMTMPCLPEKDFVIRHGITIYVGPERRQDRRRASQYENFEKLLRDFGLDRRFMPDRRKQDSSWLLLSEKAA